MIKTKTIPSKNAGTYKIINIINNKFYIGSGMNVYIRYRRHYNDLINNRHHNSHLQKAWNKYGKDSFIFETITIHKTIELNKLLEEEQYYIDNLNAIKEGYNMSPIAGSCLGIKRRRESIIKSVSKRSGKNHYLYNKKMSDEHKRKIKEANLGEKNWNYGKKASKEVRLKQSISHIGIFRGEKSYNSKLTNEKASIIRKLYNVGDTTQRKLAKKFNVSKTTIADVLNNRKWV